MFAAFKDENPIGKVNISDYSSESEHGEDEAKSPDLSEND